MKSNILKVIEEVKVKIESYPDLYSTNESAVRSQLIEPMLESLGWDVRNPSDVLPEVYVNGGKPDLTLKINNESRFLLEAKNSSKDPMQHIDQIGKYAFQQGVKYVVISNGIKINPFHSFIELINAIKHRIDSLRTSNKVPP